MQIIDLTTHRHATRRTAKSLLAYVLVYGGCPPYTLGQFSAK